MAQKQIILPLIKSTKGTHVYGSTEKEAPIPSVYVKRTALPTTPPQSITVSWERDAE